jgi:hypothetical protein
MKKWFVVLIAVPFSINAMRLDPDNFCSGAGASADALEPTVVVNKTFVVQVRENGFEAFISTKREQRGTLKTVTGLPFGIGGAASKLLEGFGFVEDTEHAMTFLDRMFENEDAFRDAIAQLEEDDANIAYLQAVFARLTRGTISKDVLVQAMRAERHKHVPEPDRMGEKDDDNDTYVVPDEHFHKWAACNCLVFHWHEQQEKQQRTPRGLKKGGSGLFKKD